jgi:hypothetical protein
MTRNLFRICTIALGLAASQVVLPAEDNHSVEGVWDVAVTVTNCQTGAVIRTVRSLQMFSHDGSFTETANTFLRGSSVGTWNHDTAQNYQARFWFFRYKPDGTFASIAQALDNITLNADGSEFTAAGSIQDFDATNTLISTGCFTHAATRLSGSGQGN